jgi:hypothetical protein
MPTRMHLGTWLTPQAQSTGKRHPTVSTQFKNSLTVLVEKMTACRCVAACLRVCVCVCVCVCVYVCVS